MSRKRNLRTCDRCDRTFSKLFRVRFQDLSNWVFVCENCCQVVQSLENYTYGGTWKAKKRH